ncbi:ribonuclease T2 [Irpex rosettiformis]|uniref:Ribonuclease T2 n=1 Tax=Irpex rosettiformis TaxID=378272 RepID=A0ACB8UJQ2_9APHY|nr:ribonuclease T2 [Irpex rosettiformis]
MVFLAGLAAFVAASVALTDASLAGLLTIPNTYGNFSGCASQPSVFSCENTTAIKNTCCSPTPGGLVLATQFWSTYTGLEKFGQKLPKASWTLHGLWPDNCDGSFGQYCDFSRQYDPAPSPKTLTPNGTVIPPWTGPNVGTFVKAFRRFDLLDWMNKYWINQGAPNADFWGHEFSKHATCTSTFDVKCYGDDYVEHQEVVDFFEAARRAFNMFPTYDMLASYGITPSNKTQYALADITNALTQQTGAVPYIGCSHNGTALSEVWYFNHVFGTEQYGRFKAVNSTTKSTCSSTQPIWYYERTKTSETEVRFLP